MDCGQVKLHVTSVVSKTILKQLFTGRPTKLSEIVAESMNKIEIQEYSV